MKIAPIVAPSNSAPANATSTGIVQPGQVPDVRRLKMTTNVTPEYVQSPQEPPLASQEQNVPSANDSAEATQPISPQFAALAKQRRALQVKERELADREKALSSQSGQTDSIALARLKSEPLKVMLENGVTYEQLTEQILANQGNSEIAALKAEINALKEGVDSKFTEREAQQEQQVLAEMKREAQQLAASSEEFEMIRGLNSVPDVMRLIEQTYRKTGEVLDVREAMKLVEDELFKEGQKIAAFKKMQSQFNPPAQQVQRTPQGMRTLTNRDTASVPLSPKARAIAAFWGNLKK